MNNKRFCTKDFRSYFRPLPTREDIERWKQAIVSQRNVRKRLINAQRWWTMNYNQIDLQGDCHSPDNDQIEPISQTFDNSIDQPVNKIEVPIIKISNCSIILANGYGIARRNASLIDVNVEEMTGRHEEEDISLSKTCGKLFNRSV